MPPGSEYIRWAKSRERFRYNIGRSSIRPCPQELLRIRAQDVVVNGPNAHGWEPLREALGARQGVSPERIVLAIGASMANHLACSALVEPGDDVLVERPCYEPLLALPTLLGCPPRQFERRAEEGWRLNPDALEQRLQPNTRLVILSDLHNPTGVRAAPDDLERIAELAERHDFDVLVDEVYLEFLAAATPRIAATRSPRMISTCSLTKAYGLDGLRAGWIVAREDLASRIRDRNDLYGIIMPHPSERLALRAIERIDALQQSVASLVAHNRALFEVFLSEHSALSWAPPAAGPIGFVRLAGAPVDSLVELLERDHDATLPPGKFFGAADHFRVGFGMETSDLEAGLDCLASALRRLVT
jgi:aspartate/methionine/tyrosine aminotransferase